MKNEKLIYCLLIVAGVTGVAFLMSYFLSKKEDIPLVESGLAEETDITPPSPDIHPPPPDIHPPVDIRVLPILPKILPIKVIS